MDYYKDKLEILLKGLLILILLVTSADAATWTVAPSSGLGIDYTRIQDAINAAASGDTIRVSSGTYYENVDVNKRLTLQGVGSPVVDAGGIANAIILNADACILEGFVASNSKSGNAGIWVASSGNTISDNTVTHNNWGIVLFSSSSSNTISDNTAIDNSQSGIVLYFSNGNTISENTASNNSLYGINLYFSNGNTISRNTASSNSFDGIDLYSSTGNTISDNTASNNSQCGIYLYSASNSNNIMGNTADGNANCGVRLDSSTGNTISGETISSNTIHGIYLDSSPDNTISGNTASDNDNCGIFLISSDNNTVTDNAADDSKFGIYILSSTDNTISGNTATDNFDGIMISSSVGNTISSNTANGNSIDGIMISSSVGNTISSNTANGNSADGIYLSDSSNNIITNNIDNSNWCGIYLDSSNGNTISQNTATGNSFCGISLVSSTDNNISGNTATGSSYGIDLDASSNSNTISGNTITGNGYGIIVFSSNSNNIYLNTFDNANNTLSDSANHWNSTTPLSWEYNGKTLTGLLGNIWSDYNGFDCDSDGIGDKPYNVAGGSEMDYHPIGGGQCSPGMEVEKLADRSEAEVGDCINYTIWVNNTGNATLSNVRAEDNLTSAVWAVGDLAPGGNYTNTTRYRVLLSDLPGPIKNELLAYGTDPCGLEINGSSIEKVTILYRPQIQVNKTANISSGAPSTIVGFKIDVSNSGNADFTSVDVEDLLPQGMDYLSDDSGLAPSQLGNSYTWKLGRLNASDSVSFNLTARINNKGFGNLVNVVNATGYPEYGDSVHSSATAEVESSKNLVLTKNADKPTAKRGEDITYTIKLSNLCDPGEGQCFDNVTLWDNLPAEVELVSVSPESPSLAWDIGRMCPGDEFVVTIVVRVPIVDINYDMEQGVRGEGFVNVHNDYDTHQGPESITNCAYAKADFHETLKSCASTKIVDPGTELKRREFGSGTYESEELLRMRTENKSIKSVTSLSATYNPTSFSLPQNRSIDYGTKWTEKSKAINTITGATMTEEYTFAHKIDKERTVDLDKNGSTMKTDVAFTGTGHIGVLKKEEPGSRAKVKPAYEAVEDYTGTFRVYELVDEYGKSVKSEKNVSGYGYVAVDKRVGSSQRTYESGTGSYQSQELIETPTNYIAKDIQLVHGPTNYNYSPGFATSQNIKWSEGMWSRSGPLAGGLVLAQSSNCGSLEPTTNSNGTPPASLISERYSSLDYLDKQTVASGLNEMNTEASFSGTADYKVKAIFSNRSGEIDNEERYVGAYDITRHVQLTGISRYDRPHITVTKEGNLTKQYFNKTMAEIMEYTITLTNDGSRSLGPITIRDIFPPGTEYISSSIRPASYSNAEANWTLLNLGIGGSLTLKLELNVTEFAPCSLVNRVMVCGMNGEECMAGAAYHVRECGELPCCPPDLVLDKSADQDPADPALIHYTIAVQNKGNSSLAATLTDLLPAGLEYVDASPKPARHEGQFLQWVLPDLEKDGLVTIEYHVRATMDGVYVNSVHADASAVDGSGYDTADAAAKVEVRSTGVAPKTTRYGGWQVPDWNMTSPDQGITVELSPEEDVAG